MPIYDEATDIESFVHSNVSVIDDAVSDAAAQYHSVKWFVTCDVEFVRQSEVGEQRTSAGFRTNSTIDAYFNPYDIVDDLLTQLDHFNERGSSWTLARILRFSVSTSPYRPLAGSSYIRTPDYLIGKQCCRNINNTDQHCFM